MSSSPSPPKLVRDRIPELIAAAGQTPCVRVLAPAAYRRALTAKLTEELAEFEAGGEVEELADLVEVIQAIVEERGVSWEAFEEQRAAKRTERGGFRDRLWLESAVVKGEDRW